MRWLGLAVAVWTAAGSAVCGSTCGCADQQPYDTRIVAPDEPTALGFSANEVEARLARPWAGTLDWGADAAQVTAHPVTGTTAVTIAVAYAFDERSVSVNEPSDTYTDASASLLGMEVPIRLLVATADGTLAEDGPPGSPSCRHRCRPCPARRG
ncbi:MAG: hypothetical protein JXP73_08490 [Deltaproteobacteria bacterium]|nr:hypothetical protein [Deltaproteobacteria bacterium]